VHAAIAAKATALGCQRVTVGGVADHVHVLLTLPATLAVAKHYSDMWRRDRRAVNSYSFS
jgi:REP element-mobilizing transposase RayT